MLTLLIVFGFLIGPAAVFWTNLVLLRRSGKRRKLNCFNGATLTGLGSVLVLPLFIAGLERIGIRIGEGEGFFMVFGIGLLLLSWFVGLIRLLLPDEPQE
jgi:hypothetical protein